MLNQEVDMTMHVTLSPELEGFINDKVKAGAYRDATEVIRDAVRRMREEEDMAGEWQAAIKLGGDQLDRGESVPYNQRTLDSITQRAKTAMHSGEPMDRDVLP